MSAIFPVPGQGTIEVQNSFTDEFELEVSGGDVSIRMLVEVGKVSLFATIKGDVEQHVGSKEAKNPLISGFYRYWWSFEPDLDQKYMILRYGCGELRFETLVAKFVLDLQGAEKSIATFRPTQATLLTETCSVPENTLNELVAFKVFPLPVVDVPTPLLVVGKDDLTMDDIAVGKKIVVAGLTQACQTLYSNAAGANFILDTPDFPFFSSAVEQSISDPNGWCNKELKRKDAKLEFGDKNPKATYLRITLGKEAWNSPGVAYVMEIWPPGHFSPVHDHGNANAIIRVLHGEIDVKLFPYLSTELSDPFATARFKPGDVTYISPGLNQIHQLQNPNVVGPTCITIQCYQYSKDDHVHWEYFDFINDDKDDIEKFIPHSDMNFKEFKAKMKAEFEKRNAPKKSGA